MLAAYVAERLPARLVVPVVAVLTIAARAGSSAQAVTGAARDAVLIVCLFAQFRLWDDLADRARDSVRHPGRTLVRASSDRPFLAWAAGLGLLNAALVALACPGWTPTAIYLAIALVTVGWYHVRTGRSLAGDHLLLLKYPAFVAIAASARPIERPVVFACSVLSVYLAACVYEAIHDRIGPAAGHSALVAGELVLLVAACSAAIVMEVRS
jgi:hypothetical protein